MIFSSKSLQPCMLFPLCLGAATVISGGRDARTAPYLRPTLTVRANGRSQGLGFALWQAPKRGLSQGKSGILRSTICSNCDGWWFDLCCQASTRETQRVFHGSKHPGHAKGWRRPRNTPGVMRETKCIFSRTERQYIVAMHGHNVLPSEKVPRRHRAIGS